MKQKGFPRFLKRAFDFGFGLLILIFSSPFFLIAALTVKIASPESPILFRQERVGYRGKTMVMYKLRTMTNQRDENGELLPDEVRLRTWGKVIRRTNLDEIPQIFNIIKGQMSLIGPRPLLAREMTVMTEEEQDKRQAVLPGITGWEAIHESETNTRRAMAEYDLYYADNWSVWLDIKILFATAFIVFFNKRPGDDLRAPKIEAEPESGAVPERELQEK